MPCISQWREPSGGKGVCTTQEKKSFARFVEISGQETILDPRRFLASLSLLETVSFLGLEPCRSGVGVTPVIGSWHIEGIQ